MRSTVPCVNDGAILTVTYSDVQGSATFPGEGNINADPNFKLLTVEDLHPQSTSPCIDAANGDLAPRLDKDGKARVDAPPVDKGIGNPPYADMGAYEYQP